MLKADELMWMASESNIPDLYSTAFIETNVKYINKVLDLLGGYEADYVDDCIKSFWLIKGDRPIAVVAYIDKIHEWRVAPEEDAESLNFDDFKALGYIVDFIDSVKREFA